MFLRSYFDEKLAQYSYLVGCQKTGEAIVIDPPRHLEGILQDAEKEGLRVTAAAETHIHADFVSGARQLAVKHEAELYLSDEGDADWKYDYTDNLHVTNLKDQDSFKIGNVQFDVLHTPGHTPESISFLLTDVGGGADQPMGIFTGDFVFVGDVGRPDLLEKSAGAQGTARSGAEDMFESLQRFKNFPDHLMIWPGHGAGSACGKSLGAVPHSTIGYEKQTNWALQEKDKKTFVDILLKEQPEAPAYFAQMKKVNKLGPSILESSEQNWVSDPQEVVKWAAQKGHFLLDTRPSKEAEKGLVPGSINIPLGKMLPNWAGWLVDYDEKIALIVNSSQADEAILALQSIHLDQIIMLIDPKSIESIATASYKTVSKEMFEQLKEKDPVQIIDVRNDTEWTGGHMEGVQHKMLGHLREEGKKLDEEKPVLIHCQSGARSAIAASVMLSLGFKEVIHLEGGFGAWKEKYPEKVTR
ncbi:MBL fold metallo-hydrolase [Jeotgalibacillus sp. ET6]|uniref:MBL fold metallo-hydrolase n=1 Tax=Jeotgalibacillus sp. ET6 TaxID=3037260 RepID=UPI00241827E6|nr:MBL fold metallo-hydrolase [Jeotgalibacillus sp. ET6]MDG5472905.1 MBL fold metallo-hydrolase [Jeotgalibacillus sp. ET6]